MTFQRTFQMTLMRNDIVTFDISFDISNNFLKGFSKENWNEMSSDISKDIKRGTGNTCTFWLNYIIFSISNNQKYKFFHCEVYAACINKHRMILSFQKFWQNLAISFGTTKNNVIPSKSFTGRSNETYWDKTKILEFQF